MEGEFLRHPIEKALPEFKKPAEIEGLNSFKSDINRLVKEYSAKKFLEIKKEKTKEIRIPEGEIEKRKIKIPEAKMLHYPAETFRDKEWFKNLPEERKKEIELEIAQHIHNETRENLEKHYQKFLENLKKSEPAVFNFFEENKKKEEAERRVLQKMPGLYSMLEAFRFSELSEEDKDKIIKAIEDFKKEFGHLPGKPDTLEPKCAGHVDFAGNIFEHYGFKTRPIVSLRKDIHMGDVALVVEIAKKTYVSDIAEKKLIPLRRYLKLLKLDRYEVMGTEYAASHEANPHFNFGSFLIDLRKFPQAEKELREAIKINPNFAIAHRKLGVLLYEDLGRKEEGYQELRKAIEIFKEYGRTDAADKYEQTLKEWGSE